MIEINTHRTLSPDRFSNRMLQYVLGVSLHSFEMAVKHVFVNLETEAWW